MKAETQEFNGERFYRYPDSPRRSDRMYFKRQGRCLHRVIWEHHNGPIPEGHEVHHRDTDPGNNAIGNLELVHKDEHRRLYHPEITPERIEFFRRFVRPKATGWHKSEEGSRWHKDHARRQREERGANPDTRACEVCGKAYRTSQLGGKSRFCSGNCRAEARRRSGADLIEGACGFCGKVFRFNRYIPRTFCSRGCAARARPKKSPA